MKLKALAPLLLSTSILAGCGTMKATSERNPAYPFSTIKTYRWINDPAKTPDDASPYLTADTLKALDSELAQRGLQSTPTRADVHATYYIQLKEELEYASSERPGESHFSGGLVYNRKTSQWKYEERKPDLTAYTIEIGTLTLLFRDAKTGDPIWRGTVKEKLDRSLPKEQQLEQIYRATKKLMARFPIQPKRASSAR